MKINVEEYPDGVYFIVVTLSEDELRYRGDFEFLPPTFSKNEWLFYSKDKFHHYLVPASKDEETENKIFRGKFHDGKWKSFLRSNIIPEQNNLTKKSDVISALQKSIELMFSGYI